jgi:hypothetical protein
MSKDRVIQLDPHNNLTVEECLAYSHRQADDYSDVITLGYSKDSGQMIVVSSNMSREQALWLAMEFIDYVRQVGRHG